MPIETVRRRWTVATWLVAGGGEHLDRIVATLAGTGADAVALQSLRERDAETIAAALGANVAWDLSYHPTSRLFAGSGVGLAVVTPHTIAASHSLVSNDHPSRWSRQRRIAQIVTVERHDHTAYAISHVVGPTRVRLSAGSHAQVAITPEQVGADPAAAIRVPDDAATVATDVLRPVDTLHELQVTTFDMPWVRGDFPVI